MSDTYSKVQETNDIANYQELTEMIIEVEKLMFWKRVFTQKFYIQQCDFLKGKEQSEDKIRNKIRSIKSQLDLIHQDVRLCLDEIRENNRITQSIALQNEILIANTNITVQKLADG